MEQQLTEIREQQKATAYNFLFLIFHFLFNK